MRDVIFLPRDGSVPEEAADKIVLRVNYIEKKAYELTIPSAEERQQCESLAVSLVSCAGPSDYIFAGLEWVSKKAKLLIAGDNADGVLNCVRERVSNLEAREIVIQFYELTHEHIRDPAEYEALTDEVKNCVSDDDVLYFAYDPVRKRNCIIYTTSNPQARVQCLDLMGISAQPA